MVPPPPTVLLYEPATVPHRVIMAAPHPASHRADQATPVIRKMRVPELTLLGRKDGARRAIISFVLGFIKLECEPILLPSWLSENSAVKIL